ncbi:MAG: peptidoglycan-binding protein [Chroococcidiopsidaceae cyanobacterium CP_BM_ER_R8_30]|nr:peptidoglycan-binding protein [Chroococcidiopsidaceae cyanobacterium CP_BM_ER_R8_30]
MTIKLTKTTSLMLGILSGIAVVSLGAASSVTAQTSKTPTNTTHTTHKSGSTSNSGSTMSPSSSSTSHTSASSYSGTLTLGSTGEAVKDLQTSLKRLGFYNGPISGKFGNQTRAAVIKFQQSKNLPADGIVGPKTRAAL